MKKAILISTLFFLTFTTFAQSLSNQKINGYRPIWFELNQKYEYSDKYSGALGTYTAKHVPMVIFGSCLTK